MTVGIHANCIYQVFVCFLICFEKSWGGLHTILFHFLFWEGVSLTHWVTQARLDLTSLLPPYAEALSLRCTLAFLSYCKSISTSPIKFTWGVNSDPFRQLQKKFRRNNFRRNNSKLFWKLMEHGKSNYRSIYIISAQIAFFSYNCNNFPLQKIKKV